MTLVRQIIIMRTDLDMPIGKMIAQGAHASEGAYLNQTKNVQIMPVELWENIQSWNKSGKTKIVVCIDSLDKLLNLVEKASELGINYYVVTDNAKTFFTEPTITCACLGVDSKENLDKVTKRLRLL